MIKEQTEKIIEDFIDANSKYGISVDDYTKLRSLAAEEHKSSSIFLNNKVDRNTTDYEKSITVEQTADANVLGLTKPTETIKTPSNNTIKFSAPNKKKSALEMMRSFD